LCDPQEELTQGCNPAAQTSSSWKSGKVMASSAMKLLVLLDYFSLLGEKPPHPYRLNEFTFN